MAAAHLSLLLTDSPVDSADAVYVNIVETRIFFEPPAPVSGGQGGAPGTNPAGTGGAWGAGGALGAAGAPAASGAGGAEMAQPDAPLDSGGFRSWFGKFVHAVLFGFTGQGNGGAGQGSQGNNGGAGQGAGGAPSGEQEGEGGASDGSSMSGWMIVSNAPSTYDLLSLQGGLTAPLGDLSLDEGTVTQVRLVLDAVAPGSIVLNGIEYPLTVPSGSTSGLKLKGQIPLVSGQMTSVVVDFDASKSVVEAGGKYLLKPVLWLQSVSMGPGK